MAAGICGTTVPTIRYRQILKTCDLCRKNGKMVYLNEMLISDPKIDPEYKCFTCGSNQKICHNCDQFWDWDEFTERSCFRCGCKICTKCENYGAKFQKCVGCNQSHDYCSNCGEETDFLFKNLFLCFVCWASCHDYNGNWLGMDQLRCRRILSTRDHRCQVKVGMKRKFCKTHRYQRKPKIRITIPSLPDTS